MDIARQKRDENIAEYILYIWQLEDLLRALKFDPRAVFETLVAPRDADDKWKLAALEWYMDIASLLEKEGKAEGGHLDHTLHLISEVNDLHLMLLQQSGGGGEGDEDSGNNGESGGNGGGIAGKYRELWEHLAPELPRLRETLGRRDVSDIELAFRALYAAILYRMKAAGTKCGGNVAETAGTTGKNVSKTAIADEVTALVSPVVALLSDLYHKTERGEIDMYEVERD